MVAERGGSAFAAALQGEWRKADLSQRERALLDYADKLTRTPGAMNEADLAPLRDAGLSDRDILDANLVVAYFAYVNRIAGGLGREAGTPHAAAGQRIESFAGYSSPHSSPQRDDGTIGSMVLSQAR